MNIYRIGAIAVALVAALIAALLARSIINQPVSEPQVVEIEVPKETIEKEDVLVSVGELSRGDRIIEGALKWQSVPKQLITDDYILRSEDENAPENYTGWLVSSFIGRNEAIIESKLIETGAGFMAAILPPGQLAIAVPVSPASIAGGFILPEDRVDVVLSYRQGSGSNAVSQVVTILRNVQVLAIGEVFSQEDLKTVTGKTATLALEPAQAELLELADSIGELSLALRSLTDVKENKNNAPEMAIDPQILQENAPQGDDVTTIGYGRQRLNSSRLITEPGSLDRRSAQ